jgi:hypothetical protein
MVRVDLASRKIARADAWLVVRGISDFGDDLKDDRFHDFAARAAATVVVDFLAHGPELAARAAEPAEAKKPGRGDGAAMRAKVSGSGAIAQGRGAKAVGARGVVVGNATGAVIVTGDGNRVNARGKR